MREDINSKSQEGELPFEEVVRRLLAAPAHHIPAKPKVRLKKPARPKRKPR